MCTDIQIITRTEIAETYYKIKEAQPKISKFFYLYLNVFVRLKYKRSVILSRTVITHDARRSEAVSAAPPAQPCTGLPSAVSTRTRTITVFVQYSSQNGK